MIRVARVLTITKNIYVHVCIYVTTLFAWLSIPIANKINQSFSRSIGRSPTGITETGDENENNGGLLNLSYLPTSRKTKLMANVNGSSLQQTLSFLQTFSLKCTKRNGNRRVSPVPTKVQLWVRVTCDSCARLPWESAEEELGTSNLEILGRLRTTGNKVKWRGYALCLSVCDRMGSRSTYLLGIWLPPNWAVVAARASVSSCECFVVSHVVVDPTGATTVWMLNCSICIVTLWKELNEWDNKLT